LELNITCDVDERIDYREIVPFQGNLKRRSSRDIKKLAASITKLGITFPFYIWKNNGISYCIDGHGRLEAFKYLESEGINIPLVPVVEVFADDEIEAKKKLLYENCKYGEMTYESVLEFIGGSGIDMSNFSLPTGKMSYSGDVTIDYGSFKIEVPKVELGENEKTGAEIVKERNKSTVFIIGKIVITLTEEEASLLEWVLIEYGKLNNGLFGFINSMFGGEGIWMDNSS